MQGIHTAGHILLFLDRRIIGHHCRGDEPVIYLLVCICTCYVSFWLYYYIFTVKSNLSLSFIFQFCAPGTFAYFFTHEAVGGHLGEGTESLFWAPVPDGLATKASNEALLVA